MEQKPTLGRIVHYSKNGDGCPSPAIVIRTFDGVNPGHGSGFGVGGITDEMHVDVLVFGLVNDYRAYNVPFSPEYDQAGTWTWPPRS